jgi:O-succinylbenzoate synthase
MIIEEIEAFQLRLPFVREFQTSSHRKSYLEHILIRVRDANGATGWGECASPSDPYYCPETVETCWQIIDRYLAPALIGREWTEPREAGAAWARIRGHHFAKAALDMACWDLWSRWHGLSLSKALGGTRESITAGVSLGIETSVDELLAVVAEHVAQGYRRVKLKIGPGGDLAPGAAVRETFPDLQLQVDANGAYTEDAAHLEVLRQLDDYRLLMIEQPFAPGALAAHARLQRRLDTPVCLDESIGDLDQFDTALALGAGRILNIKVSRMGGLTSAVAAHDVARKPGLAVWCGGMHEFGVGRAANVALASLPGFVLPNDTSGSDKYFHHDIVDPPIRATDGAVPVPLDRIGLGHEVDETRVRAQAGRSLRHNVRAPRHDRQQ